MGAGSESAEPSLSSAFGRCEGCGHSRFVHGDADDGRCLYNECLCSERSTNLRVIHASTEGAGSAGRFSREVPLVARRPGSVIAFKLTPETATQRASRLTAAGWDVQIEERAGGVS